MSQSSEHGPNDPEEVVSLSEYGLRGLVSLEALEWSWGLEYSVYVEFDHCFVGHEEIFHSLDEAQARYHKILASGGPSVLEFASEAAERDFDFDEEEFCPEQLWGLTEEYKAAATSLTPAQREIASSFHFDHALPFMEAIEAATLVTS